MTNILGISALYHDSAAALVVDGNIEAAAQEERFSRKKNDDRAIGLVIVWLAFRSPADLTEGHQMFVVSGAPTLLV